MKKSKTVYLFTGKPKANQKAQFAVLDISTGKNDLQQCADAIMRLRAEFLFSQKRYSEICFRDNNNKIYRFGSLGNRKAFENYLQKVFNYCGSLSLEKQLIKLTLNEPTIGDILIQGGSPGHAMILVDMAMNKAGEKIYLLAQSYMPAQDIHIVINPNNSLLSPWYVLNHSPVETPEWAFQSGKFKTW